MSETSPRNSSVMSQNVSGEISVEVATTFEQLASMQKEWDDFMESVGGEIFLTYDWCRVWWKHYGNGRKLMIFLFRRNGSLIGILPTFAEDIRVGPMHVKVVKIVGTDFMPVTVTLPVLEGCWEKTFKIFLSVLNEHCSWDIVYVGAVAGRCNVLTSVSKENNGSISKLYRIKVKTTDIQTYFKVANSVEEQLDTLNKKQRSNIRRAYKTIETSGLTFGCSLASDTTLGDYFKEFVSVHQSQWQKIGQAGHFVDWPHAYEFHEETSASQQKRGRLRLMKIMLGNETIGFKYAYRFGKDYLVYLTARGEVCNLRNLDFNRITFMEQVRHASSEGVKSIDSMRGYYDHKIMLGGEVLPVKNLYVQPKQFSNRIRCELLRGMAFGLDLLYLKIWRRRVAPRIGVVPKPFWRLWIRSHMFAH